MEEREGKERDRERERKRGRKRRDEKGVVCMQEELEKDSS